MIEESLNDPQNQKILQELNHEEAVDIIKATIKKRSTGPFNLGNFQRQITDVLDTLDENFLVSSLDDKTRCLECDKLLTTTDSIDLVSLPHLG